jgi:CRISPR-associated protein Csx14
MGAPSIPVDLFNPGQVFACLGFLEAADVLLGDAEGGFDWSTEGNVTFALSAKGEGNPFERALEFLCRGGADAVGAHRLLGSAAEEGQGRRRGR